MRRSGGSDRASESHTFHRREKCRWCCNRNLACLDNHPCYSVPDRIRADSTLLYIYHHSHPVDTRDKYGWKQIAEKGRRCEK